MSVTITFTRQEIEDILSALERAREDLVYSMSCEGNYDPEDIPDMEKELDRWAVMTDGLRCLYETLIAKEKS